MWSVLVVVVDVVADEAFELLLVPDDRAVEDLAVDQSDAAIGEGVDRLDPEGCVGTLIFVGALRF